MPLRIPTTRWAGYSSLQPDEGEPGESGKGDALARRRAITGSREVTALLYLTTTVKMRMRRCGLGTLDEAGRMWLRRTAFGYVLSAASEGRGALPICLRAMTR
jgi:hypothetical protein